MEDVPFKVPLGSLDDLLGIMEPVRDQAIIVPDYHQILRELQYDFRLENWVLNKFRAHSNECASVLPSCPPYWLISGNPQEKRSVHLCRKRLCDKGQRQRSLSLSSADLQRRQLPGRHFLMDTSSHEADGYSEDDEGSSTEEERRFLPQSRERTKLSLLQQAQRPGSPRAPIHSPPSRRSSRPHTKLNADRTQSIANHKAHVTKTKLQPRPSSAGPQPSGHPQNSSLQAARPRTSHGAHHALAETSHELLYALSQKERTLVERITAHGYTFHSAILALQRTGTHSAEQILEYLQASDRLCALGYEKTQVEDALEMFQNCESKASEFLRLLAQFGEMGFQQSTIKEVLLLHDNHRERALEELVTHVA